jgi:hypothetical protein
VDQDLRSKSEDRKAEDGFERDDPRV